MTAFLMTRSNDGAMHLFSDGAVFRYTGEIHQRAFKTHTFEDRGFAFTIAGSCFQIAKAIELFAWKYCADFDEFRDQLPKTVEFVLKNMELPRDAEIFHGCLVGYSAKQEKSVGCTFGTFDGCCFVEPKRFEISETDYEVSPGEAPAVGVQIEYALPTFSPDEVRSWAIKSMTDMRGVSFSHYRDGHSGYHAIGCHIQHVSVSQDGLADQIVHEWPEDKVGEHIRLGDFKDTPRATMVPRSVFRPEETVVPDEAIAVDHAMIAAPIGLGREGKLGICLGGSTAVRRQR